jgi:hypothetical protein
MAWAREEWQQKPPTGSEAFVWDLEQQLRRGRPLINRIWWRTRCAAKFCTLFFLMAIGEILLDGEHARGSST